MALRIFLAFLLFSGCVCVPKAPTPSAEPVDEGFIKTTQGLETHQDSHAFPILVVINPVASDWAPEMEWACNDWNKKLGFEAFIPLGVVNNTILPAASIVPVVIDPDMHNAALTSFVAPEDTGIISKAFIVMPVGEMSIGGAQLMAEHELGHVLGLAHDPELPHSLMHPTISSLDEELTQADVDRVRDMYLRGLDFQLPVDPTPPIPPQ